MKSNLHLFHFSNFCSDISHFTFSYGALIIGTLAIITEATLKLHGIPKFSYALRVSFPSVGTAAATARDTLNCGVSVGRCELLDEEMVSWKQSDSVIELGNCYELFVDVSKLSSIVLS